MKPRADQGTLSVREVPPTLRVSSANSDVKPNKPRTGALFRLRRAKGGRSALRARILQLGLVATVLIVWREVAAAKLLPRLDTGSPGGTYNAIIHLVTSGQLFGNLGVTLEETVLGFIVGGIGGVLLGVLVWKYELLSEVLNPFLAGMNALPRAALAPLFILWFGLGELSKVLLAVTLVLFIVLVSTNAAIRSVEAEYIRVAKSLGGSSRQVFTRAILPAAVPGIAGGLRLGIVYSLLGAVVGEMIGSNAGLGELLAIASANFDINSVFAILLILSVVAIVLEGIARLFESKVSRWRTVGTTEAMKAFG